MTAIFKSLAAKVTRWDTLMLRENGRNSADNIFKLIFINENCYIFIQHILKCVSIGPIDSVLSQIMAWYQLDHKPLSEPIIAYFRDAYICHLAPMC